MPSLWDYDAVKEGSTVFNALRDARPPHDNELANVLRIAVWNLRARTRPTLAKILGIYVPLDLTAPKGMEAFQSDARLVDAHALAIDGIFEREDRYGRSYLRIEIPGVAGFATARITRVPGRSFHDIDHARIPTLYSPHSAIVISFDPRHEMVLGALESAPLPHARLV